MKMKKYVILNGRKYEFIPLFTKKYHYYLKAYFYSKYKTIGDAYKKPSNRKVAIFYKIFDEMVKSGGWCIKILSKNNSFFTCAYTIERKGFECLVIETPTSSYIALIVNDITCDDIEC